MSVSSLVSSGQRMINLPILGDVNLMYLLIGGAVLILGVILWRTMQATPVQTAGPTEEELNRMREMQDLQMQAELQQQQLHDMQVQQENSMETSNSGKNQESNSPGADTSMNHGASLDEAFRGASTFSE